MSIIRNSKLSDSQVEFILGGFIQRRDAVDIARTLKVSRHSTERIYNLIRAALYNLSTEPPWLLKPSRQNFKGIYPIIGVTHLNGDRPIHLRIVGGMSKATYSSVVNNPKILSNLVHYDKGAYLRSGIEDEVLVDPRFKVKFVARPGYYASLVNNFFPFTMRYFRLYYGISWGKYVYFLKELEWRYNNKKNMSKLEMRKNLEEIVYSYSRNM